jgi:hypothetical protein
MENQLSSAGNPDSYAPFSHFIEVIWRRKWLFSIGVFCCFLGTICYLTTITDIYVAEAQILPLRGRGSVPILLPILGVDILKDIVEASLPATLNSPSTDKIRAILGSRHFNILLVEKYDLLPMLYSKYWDKENRSWTRLENYKSEPLSGILSIFGKTRPSLDYPPSLVAGAELLRKKLRVSPFPRDSQIQSHWILVTFEDEDPQFAVEMLARYLAELDCYLRSEAISRATDNQKHLNSLIMAQTDPDLKERLRILLLAQAEQAMYASGSSAFLFDVVDPPILPEKPAKPNRNGILLLGLFVSLVFPVGLVCFVEYLINLKRNLRRKENDKDKIQ